MTSVQFMARWRDGDQSGDQCHGGGAFVMDEQPDPVIKVIARIQRRQLACCGDAAVDEMCPRCSKLARIVCALSPVIQSTATSQATSGRFIGPFA